MSAVSDDAPDVRSSRRSFLRALALTGLAGGGIGAAMVEDVLPGGPRLRRALGLTGPDGAVPAVAAGPVQNLQLRSAARGRAVQLIVMSPPGAEKSASLPVCVALHGRGAGARTMVELGLPQFLAAAVTAGAAPFRIVAVDGGDATYWHGRTPGDDPLAMLLDELPGRLGAQGLPAPTAALGISMGGSGALRYARALHGKLDAVAVLSPALFRSWADARTVDGFRDEADWREHEPLLHPDGPLAARLGVWCGTEDPFCPAARGLADRASEAHFPRGAHTDGFWRRVLPEAMAFLGGRVPDAP
ncbi:alpha/beta hydrolase-fold protein [Kitasatospora atroaurantiaca]|uniref:alpha/beta hydrolase n=1 Tax=Kitasatospora atroaurantiaca TaxID=285545 RepID=UPI0014790DAD|nr:alpha/beta hydrolase-fold protein [Kitasatospora atroaurantiaca]